VPFIITSVKDRTIIFDLSSRNHGELLDNTLAYENGFHHNNINFYGGLFNLLPMFYQIRFYDPLTYPKMLEELLQLVHKIFSSGFQGLQE
jgi:hypothetical protein